MSELKVQNCRLDNRYDLLDCLGRGSYAEVYLARDTAARGSAPQMVVIKALNTHLQGAPDPDLERTLIENFQNEAIALDRVRHPRIVSRLGHGTAVDLTGRTFHYIVLEYLSGGDLAALCRHRPLEPEVALHYLEQVCEGLSYAHEHGVIHRDIKPQNLLLTADRQNVKIADFGVAKIKLIEAAEGLITRVGTDVYAAPEHHPLARTGPLDPAVLKRGAATHLLPAADIYSLAKTAYMLFTGEPPRQFAGKPITQFPVTITHHPFAEALLRVLRRATATDASERYQTVSEFWLDFRSSIMNGASLNEEDDAITRPLSHSSAAQQALRASASPAPQFEPPNHIGQARVEVYTRPRIVVPVSDQPTTGSNAERQLPTSDSSRREVATNSASHSVFVNMLFGDRARRWLLVALVVAAFVAMLLAAHAYVSRRQHSSTPRNRSVNQMSPVGREFVTLTDVNLRSGPSSKEGFVGLAAKGSRGRVLNVQNTWYEVEITKYARPKDDTTWLDRGWLNSTYRETPTVMLAK